MAVSEISEERGPQPKVWSVFFRQAKFSMLLLNMGSKLLAVLVILVIVGTNRNPGVDDVLEQGTSTAATVRSRRELREFIPPATCPFDFSQTPFPMTLSLCSLHNLWSESCCAAIRTDFWAPAFGQNPASIPKGCIEAVEARLLQEQIEIKYSQVCGKDGTFSDPVMRPGQLGDNQLQIAPGDDPTGPFEDVVSQVLYSEESVEEIPADTRPEEEQSVESPEDREERQRKEDVRPVFLLQGESNGSQSSHEFEAFDSLIVKNDLRVDLPVASV